MPRNGTYHRRKKVQIITRMWANAQRDGRTAEHRTTKFVQSLADAHYLTAVQ